MQYQSFKSMRKKHTSNYFLHKWAKWLDLNSEFTQYLSTTCIFLFMLWSANLHHSQLSTCLDNSCPPSLCNLWTFLLPEGRRWILWLTRAFRWALRLCLCTITLLSASQSAWTPQQRETRRTLVCKPLITNSFGWAYLQVRGRFLTGRDRSTTTGISSNPAYSHRKISEEIQHITYTYFICQE